jgi:hypothetical protein
MIRGLARRRKRVNKTLRFSLKPRCHAGIVLRTLSPQNFARTDHAKAFDCI